MIYVTCRLTAKNRDQLRNPTLGNRVWATFTFYLHFPVLCFQRGAVCSLDFRLVAAVKYGFSQVVSPAPPSGHYVMSDDGEFGDSLMIRPNTAIPPSLRCDGMGTRKR